MCSMTISPTADQHLKQLLRSGDKGIEKKLFTLADAASPSTSGPFDETSCHIKGMAPDLKLVRRRRIGNHRVFYTGYHTQCSYWAFYIKQNKKRGVDDELDPTFQNKLRAALGDTATPRLIPKPR